MKRRYRVIGLSLAFGLLVWIADGVVDWAYFHEGSLGDQLLWDVPSHELYDRSVTVAAVVAFGAIMAGVLERRRGAEKALRASEEKYRRIVETANEGVWTVDEHSMTAFVNAKMAEMLGYRAEEMIGRPVSDFLFEEDVSDHKARMKARREVPEGHYERRLRCRDGSERWVDISTARMTDDGGGFRGSFAMLTDVTERKRAEEARLRLAAVVEQGPSLVVITDVAGVIQYVNPAFERTTGYSNAESVGKNPRILKSGEHDDAFYRALWDTLKRGEVWRGHFRNRRKDGSLYDEDATICPILDASGAVVNYVGVKLDVTQERAMEAQFHHAQKMEAVGTLAGGVAHDFNNLLTAILGNVELLKETMPESVVLMDHLDQIEQASQRAAGLTRQLLAFSRRQPVRPELLDLNRVVADLEPMLRRVLGEGIRLEVHAGNDLAKVRADVGQIEQVVLNLAINAREAMPKGGRVVIETANADLDEGYAASHAEIKAGRYVMLSISDTGCGMDKATQEKVFDPFFTTKPVGKGTGLGLPVVFGIVKQAGGTIWLYSEPGMGTTFRLYFPVVEAKADTEELPTQEAEGAAGHETILLAEDEAGVRRLAQRTLERHGYRVLAAANGEEAMKLASDHAGRIDLLMTDVVMPDMNGVKLAELLAKTKSDLKVLYVSGYAPEVIAEQGILEAGKHFLAKPFHIQDLLSMVRQVMDGRQVTA